MGDRGESKGVVPSQLVGSLFQTVRSMKPAARVSSAKWL